MRATLYVFSREMQSYFFSPIAYIVISIFLLITGWFFFSTFFIFNQADLRNFFALLPLVFSFVVPAITMRLISEEMHSGSYEILLTLPVSLRQVIVGKFLAALGMICAMLIPTLAYAVTVVLLGGNDWGPMIGGYLGALLLGAAFAAIGLFTSCLTRNQIVAFIVAMIICFTLTLMDRILFFLPDSLVGVLNYLACGTHFKNISKGIVDSRDLLYFLSVSFLGLYAAHLVMQEKY